MDDVVRGEDRVEDVVATAPAGRLELFGDVAAEAAALAEAASVRSPARLREVERTLWAAQLALVRARLMLRVGDAIVSRTRIVMSAEVGGRPYAALLLDGHLPIHVSVRPMRGADGRSEEVFFVGPYDVFGRREPGEETWQRVFEESAKTIGEALARATAGFARLAREAEGRWANPPYGENVGSLAEEVWLHQQLHGFSAAGRPGEAHGACDPEDGMFR